MLIARQPWPHLCAPSLPRSPGLATASTAPSCRNAHCISLALPAKGRASHNLSPPLTWLSPSVSSSCRAASVAQLFSLLASPICSYSPTFRYFQCAHLSDMHIVEQGILCWIIAVQIVETSREETKGTLKLPFLLCHSAHYFVFRLLKTLSLIFSKPFPSFLSFFQNSWDFFCTSVKPISVPGSYSGVEPIWLPVTEKEVNSHQTNKSRWPNTWGRWGWDLRVINDRISGLSDRLNHVRA